MKSVYIFGAGGGGLEGQMCINPEKVGILGFLDNDQSKIGSSFEGKPILSPEQAAATEFDYLIISNQYFDQILPQLLGLGIQREKIVNIREVYPLDIRFRHQLGLNKHDYEVLITGNSYACNGMPPFCLNKKSLSLAEGSQDLMLDYEMAKQMAELSDTSLTHCIIGLSQYSFQYDLGLSINKDMMEKYAAILGNQTDEMRVEEEKQSRFKATLFQEDCEERLFQYRNDVMAASDLSREPKFSDLPKDEAKAEAKETCLRNYNKNYPETVARNTRLFDKTMTVLAAHDITPIVVIFPATAEYYKYASKRLQDEFYAILSASQAQHGFTLIDYFEDERFTDDDFYDSCHLNFIGAKKLCSILQQELGW